MDGGGKDEQTQRKREERVSFDYSVIPKINS